jgi:hypothetical protein
VKEVPPTANTADPPATVKMHKRASSATSLGSSSLANKRESSGGRFGWSGNKKETADGGSGGGSGGGGTGSGGGNSGSSRKKVLYQKMTEKAGAVQQTGRRSSRNRVGSSKIPKPKATFGGRWK